MSLLLVTILICGGVSLQDMPLTNYQLRSGTRIHTSGGWYKDNTTHHLFYSVQTDKVDRVVIHANDTDVIIMCLYYAPTHIQYLPELWVRTEQSACLPIHHMVSALGLAQCPALPFIHSLKAYSEFDFSHHRDHRKLQYDVIPPHLPAIRSDFTHDRSGGGGGCWKSKLYESL